MLIDLYVDASDDQVANGPRDFHEPVNGCDRHTPSAGKPRLVNIIYSASLLTIVFSIDARALGARPAESSSSLGLLLSLDLRL